MRHLRADLVEYLQGQLKPCRPGYRGQMERGVRRTAERKVYRDGVFKGLYREDVARTDIFLHKVHDRASGILSKADAPSVHGGDSAVPGQAEAEHLHHAVHRIGGEHT